MKKENVGTQKKHGGFSLLKRLVTMSIGPALVMALVLAIFSASTLKKGMQEEAIKGLRGVAVAARTAYDSLDGADFTTDESGIIHKGAVQITDNYDIVDQVRADSDYDVTLFVGDTRAATSILDKATGDRLVGTKASDNVIDTVLNKGEEYHSLDLKINDIPYYVYYVPIFAEDGSTMGMSFAGIQSAEANAYINERVMIIAFVAFIITFAAAVISIIASRKIAGDIKKTEATIVALSEGEFGTEVDAAILKRTDEIGNMAQSLQELKTKMGSIIKNIKDSSSILLNSGNSLDEMASQTSITTDEISRAIEDISKGAVSQAEEIETASMNINNMGLVIEEIVAGVDGLGRTSDDMKNASDESSVIIQKLSESNDKTTDAISKIGHQIHATNDSVQQIRQAVEIITSIADETSLLSLNASIEAARAGEHGRGFAVVASEIQKLAEQSNSSARKIEEVIDGLLSESEMTVKVMEEVEIIVAEQQEKLNETKTKFMQVTTGVDSSRNETTAIQEHTEVCDESRAKVVDVISNLSAISQENAASTEETTASMEELNATINLLADAARNLKELSVNLDNDMQFFKL